LTTRLTLARTYGPLLRFLLVHALALVVVQLAVGWCWTWVYQPNEFAGLGFVIALEATPLLVLLAAVSHTWIWYKIANHRQHFWAFTATCSWVALFNLPYHLFH
jgi:archaellum biogenesis protein FlaJ (TadC family)